MHLQIVEANGQLTRRYVANGSHCWAMCIVPNRKAAVRAELTKRLECSVASYSGLGRLPLSNIGSTGGDTGRSEGAIAVKAVPFLCAALRSLSSRSVHVASCSCL